MSRNGRNQEKDGGDSIVEIFQYLWENTGVSLGGGMCALLLLAGGGIVAYTLMGIQGKNCSTSHNWINEDSYARQFGCFAYRMLNLLPNNFDGTIDSSSQQPAPQGNVVAPPLPQQTQPMAIDPTTGAFVNPAPVAQPAPTAP